MHDAVGALAQALETDGHRQPDRNLQRHFGKSGIASIDVAVIDEMADFQENEQHGQQDRAGIDHSRWNIVGATRARDALHTKSQQRESP